MNIQDGQYCSSNIDLFDNNPLIQALPDYTSFTTEAIWSLLRKEPVAINCRSSCREKADWLQKLNLNWFVPLSRHLWLMEMIDLVIRFGYHQRKLRSKAEEDYLQEAYARQQRGEKVVVNYGEPEIRLVTMALVGLSGIGKSTAINHILSLYPQVIRHQHPEISLDQIVYLKIDCPADGSVKSLCTNIFTEVDRILGSQYVAQYVQSRKTLEERKIVLTRLMEKHRVGILVIDEIQNLVRPKRKREELFYFITSLSKSVGIPILFVGKPTILTFLQKGFSVARRFATHGFNNWLPLQKDNSEWKRFYDELWKKYMLSADIEERGKLAMDLENTFYDESQGIPEILVKLFILSQLQCIASGQKMLTAQTIKEIAKRQIDHVEPVIKTRRKADRFNMGSSVSLHFSDEDFNATVMNLMNEIDERIN